jgi:hypothetical protein
MSGDGYGKNMFIVSVIRLLEFSFVEISPPHLRYLAEMGNANSSITCGEPHLLALCPRISHLQIS